MNLNQILIYLVLSLLPLFFKISKFSIILITNNERDKIAFILLNEKSRNFHETKSHLAIGVSKIIFLNSSMSPVEIFVKSEQVVMLDQMPRSMPVWYIANRKLMDKIIEIKVEINIFSFIFFIRSTIILKNMRI
mgnify:CR=1 FL=1